MLWNGSLTGINSDSRVVYGVGASLLLCVLYSILLDSVTSGSAKDLALSYRFYGPGGKRLVGMYARHGVPPGSPTIAAGLSEP